VDQFYGIEILEWPARIAEVALWLMDHQMNLKVSEAFGQLYQRLPLKKSPTIVCGNALRLDWRKVLPPAKCSYVLGNPPFVGKKARNAEQQADMEIVFGEANGTGILDYVCCWYLRAAQYIRGTRIRVGFVSTNSISQGEQPGMLWPILFRNLNLKIHFAHRAFAWESEARGKAHVHVVIIGFGAFDTMGKRIYDYESEKVTVVAANNISPYLIEGRDAALDNRENPICNVPEIQFGNMPNDGGHFLLTAREKQAWVKNEPSVGKYLRPLLSAKEYLHGEERWCLWLKDAPAEDIRASKEILRRVEAVRGYRTASRREATKKLADSAKLFGEIRQPDSKFVLVPRHSSETRRYIPLSYFSSEYIVSDSCLFIPDATRFHFGVLSSGMHMAWVRQVCGRLESRYRYSSKLVYNNFPWPNTNSQQRERVAAKAQAVLAQRQPHLPPRGHATLADLYDPLSMPTELLRANDELDRAVEKCYRSEPFHSDRERVEFLFSLYEKLTAPLLPVKSRSRSPRSRAH